jgi:hypothetical protein
MRCVSKQCQFAVTKATSSQKTPPKPFPYGTGVNLLQNSNFDKLVPNSDPEDLDPADWTISEVGADPEGKITENARLVQLTNSTVKVSATYEFQANLTQKYSQPITDGTLLQKLSVSAPTNLTSISQVARIKMDSDDQFGIEWTDEWTYYCWRSDPNSTSLDFCLKREALLSGWHNYEVSLMKIAGTDKWKLLVRLDGRDLLGSDGANIPHLRPFRDVFNSVFIGDGCFGAERDCNRRGQFYFDRVEATYFPPQS